MNEPLRAYWNVPARLLRVTRDNPTDAVSIIAEVIDDTAGMMSLAAEWDDLVMRTSATIFQTFDWQYMWWKHFGSKPGHHLYIILFRSGEQLVGIAPFFIHSYLWVHFKIFRRLLLLGSGLRSPRSPLLSLERQGPSDYLDILVAQGFEKEVSHALIALFREDAYLWDEIELQNVSERGVLFTHVLPLLKTQGFPIRQEREDICPVISLPESMDEYLASVRTSVRRNLRYVQRGFLEDPGYRVEDIAQEGNTDGGLQILVQLHQNRWNAVGYPGLFSDPRFGRFMQEVAKSLNKKGRLWFKALRHEGKVIAVNLGFRFKNRFYAYLSGFDRNAGTSSGASGAGSALVFLSVLDSIKSGYRELDLGRGTETYKAQLTPTATQNWRITIDSVHSEGEAGRLLLFRMASRSNRIVSRITCERSIMRIMVQVHGTLRAPLRYVSHLAHRVVRNKSEELVYATPAGPSPRSNKGDSPSPSKFPAKRAAKGAEAIQEGNIG